MRMDHPLWLMTVWHLYYRCIHLKGTTPYGSWLCNRIRGHRGRSPGCDCESEPRGERSRSSWSPAMRYMKYMNAWVWSGGARSRMTGSGGARGTGLKGGAGGPLMFRMFCYVSLYYVVKSTKNFQVCCSFLVQKFEIGLCFPSFILCCFIILGRHNSQSIFLSAVPVYQEIS